MEGNHKNIVIECCRNEFDFFLEKTRFVKLILKLCD